MSQERDHDHPPPVPPFDPTPHASEPKPDRVRREHPTGVPGEPHDRCSPPSRRTKRIYAA
jgi:hypothetical protein